MTVGDHDLGATGTPSPIEGLEALTFVWGYPFAAVKQKNRQRRFAIQEIPRAQIFVEVWRESWHVHSHLPQGYW
jgi:hypothetical protein